MGEKQARTLAKQEVRRQCVAIILQAKEKDRAAMEHYQEALRQMGN